MSRLTRRGRLNPSRETKFSGTYGDRGIFIFPVQLTTSRIGNLTQLIHTYMKIDFTVDKGKGRLNPSRDKNQGRHRRRKLDPVWPSSCVTPAGASTSLTSRINGMTTHTHTTLIVLLLTNCRLEQLFMKGLGGLKNKLNSFLSWY